MENSKHQARLLGLVFLIVAIASIASALLTQNILKGSIISDQLRAINENELLFRIAIFIDLITGVAIVVLGVLLYQLLNAGYQTISLVALMMYLAEAIILAVGKTGLFELIPLGERVMGSDSSVLTQAEILGILLIDSSQVGWSIHMLFFSIGALLFYSLFFKKRLIPRWLVSWGLTAASLAFIHTIWAFMDPAERMLLLLPTMFFELTLGFWLMIKGFNLSSREQIGVTK